MPTDNGRFRQKRGDTYLSTLEKTYGEISSLPGNTPLWVLRQIAGNNGLGYILSHRDLYPQG